MSGPLRTAQHQEEKRFYQAKVAERRGLDPGDNVDRVIARARKPTPIRVTPWLVAVYLAAALVIGCDRPAETPVDQGTASLVEDDVSEHLRALGYVAWDEDADQNLSGAIVHDASAVAPGANLYTNDEDTVLLMDEQGSVLRSWELPGRMHCEHAELLSSGRLAVLCEREALVILEPDGSVGLDVPGNVHHDVAELEDGSLLVLVRDEARIYRGRAVVFDSILLISPDGETSTLWSSYDQLETLRGIHARGELETLPSPRILAHYLWRWLRGKGINRHD